MCSYYMESTSTSFDQVSSKWHRLFTKGKIASPRQEEYDRPQDTHDPSVRGYLRPPIIYNILGRG